MLLRPCRGGPWPLVTRPPYHTWRGRSSLQSGTLSSVSCQDGKKEGTPSRPCPWRILPDVASLAQARRPSLFLPPAQPDTACSVLHALRSDPPRGPGVHTDGPRGRRVRSHTGYAVRQSPGSSAQIRHRRSGREQRQVASRTGRPAGGESLVGDPALGLAGVCVADRPMRGGEVARAAHSKQMYILLGHLGEILQRGRIMATTNSL